MDEQKHTYPARTARLIVEKAIQYGMPVPKVVNMYETAKTGAKESNSTKMQGSDGKSWRAAYFTVLRNMFESGLKKYSAKMPAFCRDEVKGILTRNKDGAKLSIIVRMLSIQRIYAKFHLTYELKAIKDVLPVTVKPNDCFVPTHHTIANAYRYHIPKQPYLTIPINYDDV